MESLILNYLAPYMVANGGISYAFYKSNEKKLMENFEKMQTKKCRVKKINIPKEYKDIVDTFENHVDINNLNNLYNNIQNIKINRDIKLLLLGIGGKYSTEKNSINYSLERFRFHELMHMASTYFDEEQKINQTGFVHYLDKLSCGKALNEGYTDLMTRRIFKEKTKFYNSEVRLAMFIELLIGKESMQKYYFNNDFVGFINHLSKFIGREESLKFITISDLGFDLKKMGNPAYKAIYTNLELKLCNLFKEHNTSLKNQFDYLNLIDDDFITKNLTKIKKI